MALSENVNDSSIQEHVGKIVITKCRFSAEGVKEGESNYRYFINYESSTKTKEISRDYVYLQSFNTKLHNDYPTLHINFPKLQKKGSNLKNEIEAYLNEVLSLHSLRSRMAKLLDMTEEALTGSKETRSSQIRARKQHFTVNINKALTITRGSTKKGNDSKAQEAALKAKEAFINKNKELIMSMMAGSHKQRDSMLDHLNIRGEKDNWLWDVSQDGIAHTVVQAFVPEKNEMSYCMSLSEGAIVMVLDTTENGWWYGYQKDDQINEGFFPYYCVEHSKGHKFEVHGGFDLQLQLAEMKQGRVFKKLSKGAFGQSEQEVNVFYNPNGDSSSHLGTIHWCDKDKKETDFKKTILVSQIEFLHKGFGERQYKNVEEKRFFSIQHNGKKMLELETRTADECNRWVMGLNQLRSTYSTKDRKSVV